MPIEVLMPALSPTMTEGKLAKWLKKEGDEVSSGAILAEIDTDKATMEVEAVDEGVLGKIMVAEGTDAVPVNQVIAVLLEDGEDASALDGAARKTPEPEAPEAKDEKQDAKKDDKKEEKPAASAHAAPPKEPSPEAEPEWTGATVKQTVREALRDAMAEEMRLDDKGVLRG